MVGGTPSLSSGSSSSSQLKQAQSTNNLPPLKEANKFSSWADKNLFDQVDELLFEQDNQTPSSSSQTSKGKLIGNAGYVKDVQSGKDSAIAQNQMNTSSQKESLLSLSGSLLDLDSYEIEDEVKNFSERSNSIKQNDQVNNIENDGMGEGAEPAMTDSLDLDNSDDLNKIIQRYETLLSTKDGNQTTVKNLRESISSQGSMEESWGSNLLSLTGGSDKIKVAIKKSEKKKNSDDYDYEQDGFEQTEEDEYEEDEDNLVEEEIYLNSSIGKKDSEFLSELLNQPIRTKQSQQVQQEQQKKGEQVKNSAKSTDSQDSSSGEYQDEIDEFIKRHIENEEMNEKKFVSNDKSNLAASTSKKDLISSSSTTGQSTLPSIGSNRPASVEDEIQEEPDKRTPRQVLLDEFKKLSDVCAKYSLTDREMFLSDFDNILKILSYDEVKEYILPCIDIYQNEQEFLKLQFFQKLPSLFKKLLKQEINHRDAFGIMEFQIFPLISKMLINSEEQVQTEGVEALLSIAKDSFTRDQSQIHIFALAELIIGKAESSESAKIAVLMIVERFSEAKIFTQEQCSSFITDHLQVIQKGMLFKIKKFLLPTLLAVSQQVPYEMFEKHVYSTFVKFTQDDIWGVRKVCLEKLQDFVKLIRPDETSKLCFCLQFLQSSMNDSSRWVKNQAFSQFGYIVHEIYLKLEGLKSPTDQQLVQELIDQSFEIFFDPKFITSGEDDQQFICQSFMNNQNDDVDKIKFNWAFFLSCALLINGGQVYWERKLKGVYEKLFKDILINVRKSLASSIVDVMKLVDMNNEDNQNFFTNVFTTYLNDIDDVKQKMMPKLCQIISLFPKEHHNHLLSTLIREQLESEGCKKRDTKIELLEQVYALFAPQHLAEQEFHQHLIKVIQNEPFVQFKKRACKLLGAQVIAPLIKSKKYRKQFTSFIDELRMSKNFRNRQLYLFIAKAAFQKDQEIFKKHFAKAIGQDMGEEKIKVVQIQLAKVCFIVPEAYSKSIDKVRQFLREKVAPVNYDVTQYMTKEDYQRFSELRDTVEQPEEEQKVEDEDKERESLEKTVSIRFANFSSLTRGGGAGGLGEFSSIFSNSIMALLGGFLNPQSHMSKASEIDIVDKSEEALLGNSSGTGSPWQS